MPRTIKIPASAAISGLLLPLAQVQPGERTGRVQIMLDDSPDSGTWAGGDAGMKFEVVQNISGLAHDQWTSMSPPQWRETAGVTEVFDVTALDWIGVRSSGTAEVGRVLIFLHLSE